MELVEEALCLSGFSALTPLQREALRRGLLEGKNLVVAAPTASGKTFLAEIAFLRTFRHSLGKTLYTVPLVALASEKFEEFKRKYEPIGAKVALSVGDLDSADPWLERYDLIVVSNEKLDSLLRHGAPWIRDVALLVVDEVHLLTDPGRGPTLEVILTRLRSMLPRLQVLALSATIKNASDLAEWLKAEVVSSNWRPIKLYAGVAYPWQIKFLERKGYELNSELPLELAIAELTLKANKQALYFVATRRAAEALAERVGKVVERSLGKAAKRELKRLATEAESALEVPTRQCKRLAKCLRRGTAFHHAGLVYQQRRLVESNFIKGLIKVVVATPTLALGLNLPSFRVVIRDLKRYHPVWGSAYLPVLEVQQMMGRAGRPGFDEWGEGILLARDESEAEDLFEHYVLGEVEEIVSKLGSEPALRIHTLALIAGLVVRSELTLKEFFEGTFFAFQYGNISELHSKLVQALDALVKWGFITRESKKLQATRLGQRVSELYLDPLTAHNLIQCLHKALHTKTEPFSWLQVIAQAPEVGSLSLRTGEWTELESVLAQKEEAILQPIPELYSLEREDFLRSVKTALMFEAWINEATEDRILEDFGCTPGEFRTKLQNADWLVYSLQELALLLGYKPLLKELQKLRLRLQYGVKEELLPLIRLRQVGRVRARQLYNAGLKTLKELRDIPYDTLARIIGPKLALSIKEQLSGKRLKWKQSVLELQ